MKVGGVTEVVPLSRMKGDSRRDTSLLRAMYKEARDYTESFSWCRGVKGAYFGLGVGGVVAVFLFRIEPNKSNIDEWLWVVVGDLPSAYLVTDVSPTPAAALQTYVREMKKWVRAARSRRSVKELIPVNVPATRSWANRLRRRLEFLERDIVPLYRMRSK